VSVLERNLAELLRRYRAITPDAQFRQRLEVRFVAEALDAVQPAPAPVLRPRFGSPVLRRAGLLAAAGILAMVGAWWLAEGGPPHAGLEELVARSGAALRTSEDGSWQGTSDTQFTLPGDYLELAGAGRAELSLHLPDALGEVGLLAGAPPRASFARAGDSVRVTLLAGRGALRRPGADESALPLGRPVLVSPAPAGPALPAPGAGAPTPLAPTAEPPPPIVPGELRGLIVRAEDGQPVTAARLILATTDITDKGPKTIVRELDDKAGRFRWAPPPGRYHLFVQADGYATRITRNVVIDAKLVLPELRLQLERGVTVSGRVLDPAGAPVEGALVISDTDAPAIMVALAAEYLRGEGLVDIIRERAITDADGRFELTQLSSAGQVLRASSPTLAPAWLALPPGPAEDVTLSLGAPGSLAGRVLREDGTPWEHALMIASFNCPEPAGHAMSLGIDFTDAEGHYHMQGLPPTMGVVLLIGDIDGRSGLPPMQATQIVAGQTARADFGSPRPEGGAPPAPEGSVLVGTLRNADGTPATGRMLSLAPLGTSERTDWTGSMVVESGAFRFEHVRAGTYNLYAAFGTTGEVAWLARVDVADGEPRELDLQLEPGALAGRALDAAGAPLLGARVIVMADTPEGRSFAGTAIADETGAWLARSLPPGRYWIGVYDARGQLAAVQLDGLQVTDGVAGGIETVHAPGGHIVVHVVGHDGAPAALAPVLIVDSLGLSWQFDQNTLTDRDGVLPMDGVPPGRYRVSATVGAATATGQVDVAAGQTAELTLTLP
jgi:hypothetical protein